MPLDGMSLDQLRTFIAAAEEGSFSAAGRKLRRAQSVVSQTLANLENQLGVRLFDRDGRYPRLTDQGQALLNDARVIADGMDCFKARAKVLREGVEPELSLSVDVMYPMSALTEAVGSFFGFEHMPLFMVEDDIARDRLRAVRIEMPGTTNMLMPMHAVYRKDAPPGPAGRWLIQKLKQRARTGSSTRTDGAKRSSTASTKARPPG